MESLPKAAPLDAITWGVRISAREFGDGHETIVYSATLAHLSFKSDRYESKKFEAKRDLQKLKALVTDS